MLNEEEYYDFDSFKEVFLSNIPDKLESTDQGKEWLKRRREETLDTETPSNQSHGTTREASKITWASP